MAFIPHYYATVIELGCQTTSEELDDLWKDMEQESLELTMLLVTILTGHAA
jgi:hypothetical protein